MMCDRGKRGGVGGGAARMRAAQAALGAALLAATAALGLAAVPAVAAAAAGVPPPARADATVQPASAGRATQVVVDVVPGICPNYLRIDSQLTVPVGVIGTEDLEVTVIDPVTVRLSREGGSSDVLPLTYDYRDVGSPLIGGRCECQELIGDGLRDLVFYFDVQALLAAIGPEAKPGDTVPLVLTGQLVTGQVISGMDCALVIDAGWADGQVGHELGFLGDAARRQTDGHFRFAYFSDISDHLTLSVHDAQGRPVACLVDRDLAPGIYNATWDGTGAGGQPAPPGTYFARVSNSRRGSTIKFGIPGR